MGATEAREGEDLSRSEKICLKRDRLMVDLKEAR